jgi:hypothetical protein
MELERGRCLIRIGTEWTTIRTLPPPPLPEDDPTARILSAMPAGHGEEPRTDRSPALPEEEPDFVQ